MERSHAGGHGCVEYGSSGADIEQEGIDFGTQRIGLAAEFAGRVQDLARGSPRFDGCLG